MRLALTQGANVKDELIRIARNNGERARVKAARVAVLLRVYRSDPVRNAFLRLELEALAKAVVYHMRQAVIVGALIDRQTNKHVAPGAPVQTRDFRERASGLR